MNNTWLTNRSHSVVVYQHERTGSVCLRKKIRLQFCNVCFHVGRRRVILRGSLNVRWYYLHFLMLPSQLSRVINNYSCQRMDLLYKVRLRCLQVLGPLAKQPETGFTATYKIASNFIQREAMSTSERDTPPWGWSGGCVRANGRASPRVHFRVNRKKGSHSVLNRLSLQLRLPRYFIKASEKGTVTIYNFTYTVLHQGKNAYSKTEKEIDFLHSLWSIKKKKKPKQITKSQHSDLHRVQYGYCFFLVVGFKKKEKKRRNQIR